MSASAANSLASRSVNGDNVKSVTRAFEILECFAQERRPLNATHIARALRYPQSSTQALLKTMVNLGYLTYDNQARAYFPTPKILLKIKWLEDSPMANSSLLDAMDDLRKLTDETVVLASYRDMDMHCVQVTHGSHRIALQLHPGDRVPLFTSAIGLAFLADQTDAMVARYIARGQKLLANDSGQAIDPATVKDAVDQVRLRGAAIGYGLLIEGVGAIAGAIRCPTSGATYVLGVCGPDNRIAEREHDIITALRQVTDAGAYPPPGFLESTVRPGLERITRRFEAYFDNELRDAGINSRESRIIGLLLAKGALDTAQISAHSAIPRAAVTETLASLTTKALITKNKAHHNLTARGRELASGLSEKLRIYRSKTLGPITGKEALELQRTLDRLSEWIKSAASTRPQ